MKLITKDLAQLWANGKCISRKLVGKLMIETNENSKFEFVLQPMGGSSFQLIEVREQGVKAAKGKQTKQVDIWKNF